MSMTADSYADTVSSLRVFKPDGNHSGVKLEGILRLEEDGLVLEYQEISSWTGQPRTQGGLEAWLRRLSRGEPLSAETRTLHLPFAQLDYLEGRNWFFFTTLRLTTDRLSTFAAIPGARQGILRLHTGWRERHRGLRFVANANLHLAEWRMRAAEANGGGSRREERFKVL